jgi:anti-sigma factor RsiW
VTCKELVEFLMDYLDGILSETQRTRFGEHLAECPNCAAYLATCQEAVRIGKAVCSEEHEAAPPHVPEELVQAILSARSGKWR